MTMIAIMIAALRARHRRWIAVLAVIVPLLYALSLRARPPAPWGTLGTEWSPVTSPLVPIPGVALEAGREVGPQGAVLVVRQRRGFLVAEPLLYWTAGPPPAAGEPLPADAVFLAALDRFEQRAALPARGGAAVIYSLGHAEVVAAWNLEGAAR